MRAALNNNEELCELLIPNWTLGCRRLTPGEGYLESFLLPTVSLEKSPIATLRIGVDQVETSYLNIHKPFAI